MTVLCQWYLATLVCTGFGFRLPRFGSGERMDDEKQFHANLY